MNAGTRTTGHSGRYRNPWPAGTRLLLAAAADWPGHRQTEAIAAAAADVEDWAGWLRIASQQKVVPLLYPKLKAACGERVPEPVLAAMKRTSMASTQHNLMLATELLALLREASAARVPMLCFKGPVLAASAYGNLASREFGDLDLLVRAADAPRAAALLTERGYRESTRLNLSWERTFAHPDRDIEVDLHWAFAPTEAGLHTASFRYDIEGLWNRVRTIPVLRQDVPTLGPEDTLIALCQNATKDFFRTTWPSLSWFCDLSQVIRTEPDMDWYQIDHLASRHGCRRIVHACVDAAAELFCLAVDLPPTRRDRSTRLLASDLCHRMLANLRAPLPAAADLPLRDRLRFHWLARERWQDRAAHLLRPRLLLRAYRYQRRTASGIAESDPPEPDRRRTDRTLTR